MNVCTHCTQGGEFSPAHSGALHRPMSLCQRGLRGPGCSSSALLSGWLHGRGALWVHSPAIRVTHGGAQHSWPRARVQLLHSPVRARHRQAKRRELQGSGAVFAPFRCLPEARFTCHVQGLQGQGAVRAHTYMNWQPN